MVRISEVSFKNQKNCTILRFKSHNNNNNSTSYLQKFQGGLQNLAVRSLNRLKKFLKKSLMPAFLFLRTYENSSYKSSSMKSVRAAAIMFVSVTRYHSAKHLHKCAQLLRSPAISLKFKNLHWMLVSVRLYLDTWTRLALSVLKRLRGIQFSIKKRAVLDPFTTQQNICSNVHNDYASR